MLHYETAGEGAPLVLVHGILSDRHYWRPVRGELEKRYQVTAIDLRGFGKSPKPTHGYTLDEQADAVARVITRVTDKPVVLVAHSMGSLISARLAARYPELVARLVLLNPPINQSDDEVITALKTTGLLYRIGLYSPLSHTIWPLAKLLSRTTIHRLFSYMTPSHTHHSRQGSLRLVESTRFHELLAPLTMPVDIINGTYDRPQYRANLKLLPDKPNIRIHTVETGHHTIYREPGALLDLL